MAAVAAIYKFTCPHPVLLVNLSVLSTIDFYLKAGFLLIWILRSVK